MDRGSDDFEVYTRAVRQGVDWVGRAKSLHRRVCDAAGRVQPVQEVLEALPQAGGYTLKLRARPGQPARTARVVVSYGPLTLMPPRQPAHSLKRLDPQPIPQSVVWAREVDPPPGLKEPIAWVLYTSLPVPNFEDAREIIAAYEKRWRIEEWHKALKSGCHVTARQLKTSARLEALVGLLGVVAVRLLQIKGVARTEPDLPAVAVVPPRYVALLQGARKARSSAWSVSQFFRELAKLGGFLGRKGDGEPGWITIWRGWEKIHLMLRGIEVATRYDL
jgi:hypothetical protein